MAAYMGLIMFIITFNVKIQIIKRIKLNLKMEQKSIGKKEKLIKLNLL